MNGLGVSATKGNMCTDCYLGRAESYMHLHMTYRHDVRDENCILRCVGHV